MTMKNDRLLRFWRIPLTLVCALLLLIPTTSLAKAKYHWRFQCAFAEADLSYKLQTVEVAKLIEKASEGQIKVDTYSAGALVGPEELFGAVADGTIELGLNMSMAETEFIPEAMFLSIHGGPRNMEELYEYQYKTDLFGLVQEAYREKGAHLLASVGTGRIMLRARKTGILNSWDTFKGTKGFASPQIIPVLTKLGGICVDVPGYDMYSAMKLGTIDWHEWTIAELESLGWKEVTKTLLISPPTFVGSCNVFINLKAWEALDPELQKKIQTTVIDNLLEIGQKYVDENAKALEASKKYGVEFVKMSDADIAKFTQLCVEDWGNLAKINPRCAKAAEIVKAFVKSKGHY